MSYILDALKKSERERALGRVPTLDTPVAAPRRRAWRWAAAAAALLALAGGAGWWLAPRQAVAPATPAAGTGPAPAAARAPAPRAPTAASAVPPGPPPAPAAAPGASAPATPAPAVARAGGDLPEVEVNVISYSRAPERRFVMINLQRYREGETTREGLRILRIAADGVEVVYRGERRFLRP